MLGLPNGKYSVAAESVAERSDTVLIDFARDGPIEPLRIVTHPRRTFRGRIVSEFGPVVGAPVFIGDSRSRVLSWVSATSTPDGSFAVSIEPDVRELDVIIAAPGFAYALRRIVYDGSAVDFAVRPRGGTLQIDARTGQTLFLRHNDVALPLSLLALQWNVSSDALSDDGETRLIIAMMDPGPYSLCTSLLAAPCTAGILDPLGTLILRSPSHDSTISSRK